MSIELFPGNQVSPTARLAQFLERAQAGEILGVVIVAHWQDKTFSADCSTMAAADLCMAAAKLDIAVKQKVFDDLE